MPLTKQQPSRTNPRAFSGQAVNQKPPQRPDTRQNPHQNHIPGGQNKTPMQSSSQRPQSPLASENMPPNPDRNKNNSAHHSQGKSKGYHPHNSRKKSKGLSGIFQSLLPPTVYNPETKKILGFLSSEDLLLVALIFLFLDNDDEDNTLMVLALIFVLISDYIDLSDFSF